MSESKLNKNKEVVIEFRGRNKSEVYSKMVTFFREGNFDVCDLMRTILYNEDLKKHKMIERVRLEVFKAQMNETNIDIVKSDLLKLLQDLEEGRY